MWESGTVVPLLSAVLGGVVATALTHVLGKRKTDSEIRKIEAETEKIRAETETIRGTVADVSKNQDEQQSTVEEIQRFLVRSLITEHEQSHLKRLEAPEPWPFVQDQTTQFFLDEIRNLRSLGLITGHPNKGTRSLLKEKNDVKQHFQITDAGRTYLAYLKQVEG